MRSILDAIKGEDGWRGLGSPGLNQGQQPALTSAPCEAELAPNPGHPPTDTSPERGGPRLPAHRQPPMESDHTSVWSPDSHHLPQARHESSHGAARHGVPQAHNGSDATAQVPGSLVRAAACEAASEMDHHGWTDSHRFHPPFPKQIPLAFTDCRSLTHSRHAGEME